MNELVDMFQGKIDLDGLFPIDEVERETGDTLDLTVIPIVEFTTIITGRHTVRIASATR